MTIVGCMQWLETQTKALDEEVQFIFGEDDPVDIGTIFQVRKTGETPQHFFDKNRRVHDLDVVIYIDNANGYVASQTQFETLTGYILTWIYEDFSMGGNCVAANPIGMVDVEQQDDSPLQLRVLTLEITTDL